MPPSNLKIKNPHSLLSCPVYTFIFFFSSTMASSFSSLPFLLALFLTITIFISPSQSALTCSSQKLPSKQTYANCTDLPTLGATLHFTLNTTNNSIAIAFSAAPPTPDGWVAWGINLAGGGMVGAQSLIAYKVKNTVEVHPYNLTSYKGIDLVKSLSVETWDLAAQESDGAIVIFAAVKLPEKVGNITQIWQVGPVDSGKPKMHLIKPENLGAKLALPTVATTAAGGNSSTGNTTAGGDKSGGVALVMGERFGLGFYLSGLVLVFMSFITM